MKLDLSYYFKSLYKVDIFTRKISLKMFNLNVVMK